MPAPGPMTGPPGPGSNGFTLPIDCVISLMCMAAFGNCCDVKCPTGTAPIGKEPACIWSAGISIGMYCTPGAPGPPGGPALGSIIIFGGMPAICADSTGSCRPPIVCIGTMLPFPPLMLPGGMLPLGGPCMPFPPPPCILGGIGPLGPGIPPCGELPPPGPPRMPPGPMPLGPGPIGPPPPMGPGPMPPGPPGFMPGMRPCPMLRPWPPPCMSGAKPPLKSIGKAPSGKP